MAGRQGLMAKAPLSGSGLSSEPLEHFEVVTIAQKMMNGEKKITSP